MPTENSALIAKDPEAGGWADQIVDHRQLKGYPPQTLHCARALRITIVAGVFLTLFALLTSFFGGALAVETETVKHAALPLKRLVVCPSWHQTGMNLTVQKVSVGNLFTSSHVDWRSVPFTAHKCPPFKYYKFSGKGSPLEAPQLTNMQELATVNGHGCWCVDTELMLASQSVGKDFVRIALHAGFTNDPTKMVSVGINGGGDDYPGDWNYAAIGARTVADLTRETSYYGKTSMTQGTAIEVYTLGIKNALPLDSQQVAEGTNAELVIAYGSYFENQISDISSLFSPYALFSLLAILLATLNALQLFGVCFPEKVDDSDPQQLEPSFFLQATIGKCSSCCQRYDEDS